MEPHLILPVDGKGRVDLTGLVAPGTVGFDAEAQPDGSILLHPVHATPPVQLPGTAGNATRIDLTELRARRTGGR